MITGNIHSIETMGTHDGPGVRTVFFLQGCPLQCRYCHNPDSQCFQGGTAYTVDEIVKLVKRYRPYYGKNGGVTFSGGEALMQGRFLLAACRALKAEGIHVAVDTSGVGQSAYYEQLFQTVDMFIVDIKDYDPKRYKALTGVSKKRVEVFLEALKDFRGALWLRHVMVPGITDDYDAMDRLALYLQQRFKSLQKIEILPFHKMGSSKYRAMGLEDPMADVPAMDSVAAKALEQYLIDIMTQKKKAV